MNSKLSLQEFKAYVLSETAKKNDHYWAKIHKFNRSENYPYHSVVKNDFKNLTNEVIFERCLNEFCEIIYQNYNSDGVTLYRAIALQDLTELQHPLVTYCSYVESEALVYDDCGFPHDKSIKRDDYILRASVKLNDINWADSFELYLMLDFAESEIRVNPNNSIENTVIRLATETNYTNLPLEMTEKTNVGVL